MSTAQQDSSTHESKRINALHGYSILNKPQEDQFGHMAKLASFLCGTPIALIALVDEDLLWFKSTIGITYNEMPQGISFCEHTLTGEQTFEVYDARSDERFKAHPSVVGKPHIRFYAGTALIDEDGSKLGALCVFDTAPRKLSDAQKEGLEILARTVVAHISLKKKSEVLIANNHRYEELLNITAVSPEIHCILDYTGKVLFINNAITNILEYTVEEAIGLNIWNFCHREDINRIVKIIEEGLRNKIKEFVIDFRIVSKTGVIRWLGWSMVAKNGRWYAYGRDITENKKVEHELMKLSFVASKVNNAIVINDANNHVTWVNEAFEKITGFNLDDLKGRRLGDLIAGPETDMALMERARAQTKLNQSFTVDLLAYRKDGQPIWLSIYNTVVFNDLGNVEIEVEIIIDITDKKRVEREMLEAKEQALQLSEAKEMFLSVMSHEIRTPLNAVIGMTHLLIENDPRASQIEDLNILKFSGENLLNIINDILDFTKMETGNLQLEALPFSMKALTTDIITSLYVGATKKGNILELLYDDQIPHLSGDKTRLYQILMNLLGNAIKFTDQGKIILSVKLLEQDAVNANLYFEISDTGIGIPEDKLSYIFETFTQAKTDISRKYGGTGLGLAITKKLLELYNSEIQVKSREGAGTTFSFALRFAKASAAVSEVKPALQPLALSGKKILIVDDNEINLLIAKRILTKYSLEIDFALSGEEALEMVQKNIYDLVFMDIKMPGIDGFETTVRIRNLGGNYFSTVPIIALTASTLNNEIVRFKQSGMNGHILKPFKLEEIRDLLSAYLQP
ncbi:PAS domain S-box-containing protein [Pedobacter sp. AK017]|uniref:ATP-binding protein n=1 Tax=Pedobacter sp. AK017 TaxID=2723073 RepID=UPI0016113388|nr:ATP-binding protein [Pedobacter sp. AK017]MBB5438834.1 PAS domain S-box-containing protein [Pedobacter sp. AK017]